MADTPIGSLPEAGTFSNDDLMLVVQGSGTYKVEVRNFVNLARQGAAEYANQAQAAATRAVNAANLAESWSANPPKIDAATGHWFVWDLTNNAYIDSGYDASITIRISEVVMEDPGTDPYVENTGTDTDPVFHLHIPRGQTGNGIVSITKTGTQSNIDTYTIAYTNGQTSTILVTNGVNGQDGADGISPEFYVRGIPGGHELYWTDAKHPQPQMFEILDGNDGQDGVDGVSPAITITEGISRHTITIVDANHPNGQSFVVLDGDMSHETYDPQETIAGMGGFENWCFYYLPTKEVICVREVDDQYRVIGNLSYGDYFFAKDTLRKVTDPNGIADGQPFTNNNSAQVYICTELQKKQPQVVYRTVTLLSPGWSNKEQTVTVQGISATETDQKIEPMPAGASYDAYESCGVRAVAQAANSLTFRCDTVPSGDLTVYVCITALEAAT